MMAPPAMESAASTHEVDSHTTPIPTQNACGYMQISSESTGNCHVPFSKKSACMLANRLLNPKEAQRLPR